MEPESKSIKRWRTSLSSHASSSQHIKNRVEFWKVLPLEFRGASLCWSAIFQAPSYVRGQPMYLLATSRVSVDGKMAIGAWLPVGRGVKASTVVGVVGLLQFWPSSALLTNLTKLGAGLAQVSWWPKATTVHWTTMMTEEWGKYSMSEYTFWDQNSLKHYFSSYQGKMSGDGYIDLILSISLF